jgi:polysaccharide export outer membrane protein
MTLKWLVFSVALLAGPLMTGVADAQAPTKSAAATRPAIVPAAAPVPSASDYVIGAEDVLQISVWKNESLSRQLPVRPDGKVSMPLLHDIQAAGLTPMQLRDKIATALAEFMPNPEVSVTVLEVRSYRVSVLGEVQRPGVLQLRAPTTVLEAIALAGGFRDFASPSRIVIFRKNGQGTEKLRFNYNRAVSAAATEENLSLRSGDVVVVP